MNDDLTDFERELLAAAREARAHAEGRERLKVTEVDQAQKRLSKLTVASMPWLSPNVDLAPEDGGQETFGPETYKKLP